MDFDRKNFENQEFNELPERILCSNFTRCTFNASTTFERCNLMACTFNAECQFDRSNVIPEEEFIEREKRHNEMIEDKE